EGVVRTGLDQQGVYQVGVVGEAELQVEQAAADQAGAVLVGLGVVRTAHAGADLGVQDQALAVDHAGAVAQTEAALAVVGGEIVAFVAHRGGQLAVLAQLQRAAGAGGVAVGGGLALAVGAAVVGGLRVLGAGAQA